MAGVTVSGLERGPSLPGRVPEPPRFVVLRLSLTDTSHTVLVDRPLPEWPRTASGAAVRGPAEAAPQWARRGTCAAFSDDVSDSLTIIDLITGTQVNGSLGLPATPMDLTDNVPLGPANASDPPPRHRARFARLWIEDATHLLFLRSTEQGHESAWRLDIATGKVTDQKLSREQLMHGRISR